MKKSSLSGNESPRGNEDVEEVVGDNQNVDAVFGQIREGGPNYRNVRAISQNGNLNSSEPSKMLTPFPGGMVRYLSPYDEDSDWSRCSVFPCGFRYPGYDSGSYSHVNY